MIKRLQVDGYKTLSGADVTFAPLTVIFGANSSGKSNLFDALGLLSRIATEPTLESAFKLHRGEPLEAFTFGPKGLRGLLEQSSAQFTLSVDVELDDDVVTQVDERIRRARQGIDEEDVPTATSVRERYLRYEIVVEIFPKSAHLRVMDESLQALRDDGEPSRSRKPFLERVGKRLLVRVERQGHPRYEDLGQEGAVISKSLYAPHHPHMVAFREELRRWRFYYLEPTLMREEVPIRDVESLDPQGHQIAAFFNSVHVANPRQMEAFGKSLSAVVPMLSGIEVEQTPEGRVRLFALERDMPVSARLMSEGSLRVLGLLAITNPREPVSVVGYEEPENGIHPRRLALVAELLSGVAKRRRTQLLINTHSPLLPDYFIQDPAAEILRAHRDPSGMTVFERFAPTGPLFASNEITEALDEETPFRERVARGDYGG
jgi:predicted ATPase